MARSKADKQYKSFEKGLITEATGLTYPENSCRDLDNVDIEVSGAVRRRLAVAQERDGLLIAGGELTDTLYTNDSGGPLSLAPSVVGSSVSKTYDGVTGNGDWTFGEQGTGVFDGVVVNAGGFEMEGQNGQSEFMTQDLNINDYDRITLQFDARELTSNEGSLNVLIGATSAGAGQGISINDNYFRTVSTSGYLSGITYSDPLYSANLAVGVRVILTLTKLATNSYFGSVVLKDSSDTVLYSTTVTIGTSDGYLSLFNSSGQSSRSRWRMDDMSILLEIFDVSTDLPDTDVAQYETAISTHSWNAPNGDDSAAIQVFQIGNLLTFYSSKRETISQHIYAGAPNYGSQQIRFDGIGTGFIYNVTAAQAAQVKLQSAVGQGRIWFTSPAVIPFYAEVDPDSGFIRLKAVGALDGASGVDAVVGKRLVRDLVGIEDGLDPSSTPATLTDKHLYNLLNQGWPSDKINDYFTSQSNYPSNSQQWFRAKDSTDDFDPSLLVKQEYGTSNAPKGRLLIDALVGDRDGVAHSVSGSTSPLDFTNTQDLKATSGWETVAFFAGRIWLAGEKNAKRPSGVYFSKTVESPADACKFYQQNDPTSEYLNDLLATDGGFIPIPEAGSIRKLAPFGSGLVVLADSGVWFVYGRGDGFTAANYSYEKLSAVGVLGAATVVTTDSAVFFWAQNSIHVISSGDQANGLPKVVDIGEKSVFKYYTLIGNNSREAASGVYDPVSKKVYWFWLSDNDLAADHKSLYDRALIFDTRTGAFSKYSFPYDESPLFGIAAAFPKNTPTTPIIYELVTTGTGEVVTDSALVSVYAGNTDVLDATDLTNSLKLVMVSGSEEGLRLAEFLSLDFYDFEGFTNFESVDTGAYIITGDETMGDLQRKKQATYVHSFFQKTENGFYADLSFRRPSGCLVSGHWDWHTSSSGNRWSPTQAAYRFRRAYAPVDASDTFDTGESIVYTKVKMRGQGRALAVKYESVEGKDFRLLGFSIPFTADED